MNIGLAYSCRLLLLLILLLLRIITNVISLLYIILYNIIDIYHLCRWIHCVSMRMNRHIASRRFECIFLRIFSICMRFTTSYRRFKVVIICRIIFRRYYHIFLGFVHFIFNLNFSNLTVIISLNTIACIIIIVQVIVVVIIICVYREI